MSDKAYSVDKVVADLAKASREDADRRVVCPVCHYRTANIESHQRQHGTAVERDCEHDRLVHSHATIWVCEDCQREIELDAAAFGGPDTVAEANGDK